MNTELSIHDFLACPTPAAWVEAALGVETSPTMAITYTMLAKAFDLPVEHKHPIAMGLHQGDGFLELDQYPQGATPRPRKTEDLFPGVALTLVVISATVVGRALQAGYERRNR